MNDFIASPVLVPTTSTFFLAPRRSTTDFGGNVNVFISNTAKVTLSGIFFSCEMPFPLLFVFNLDRQSCVWTLARPYPVLLVRVE
ncbi:hypothetical protein CEXT_774451 [Caerostris extrusa]|uniref:Uncharacterized protein n=1 Tax=Caerostris extrusa TaxID=172846 RepID=A0AAV4M727_CAEEX|nr:hypothetical protein CEXT_774451 [Caerostris extrusa]